jgi:transposase-like protein
MVEVLFKGRHYIKVKGRWTYLYRAVNKVGRTVDFYLSERRDVNAAKHFFRKAMKSVGSPRVITLDAYAASHSGVRELKSEGRMPKRVRMRLSKYLNNMIEQDHRRIKPRIHPTRLAFTSTSSLSRNDRSGAEVSGCSMCTIGTALSS